MDQATIDERIRTTPAIASGHPVTCLRCGGDKGNNGWACWPCYEALKSAGTWLRFVDAWDTRPKTAPPSAPPQAPVHAPAPEQPKPAPPPVAAPSKGDAYWECVRCYVPTPRVSGKLCAPCERGIIVEAVPVVSVVRAPFAPFDDFGEFES